MRFLLFLACLFSCAATACAGDFAFLKPYGGVWFGSAQTSFGPAALELALSSETAQSPRLDFKIRTNTLVYAGGAVLSGGGSSYLLELSYTRGDGPVHHLRFPVSVRAHNAGRELELSVVESTETFRGSVWLSSRKRNGAYQLEITLPGGLRIAGVPLPLPPKLPGVLKTSRYSAQAQVPVFPGIALEARASRNSAADSVSADASFALYSFNCKLHKAKPQAGEKSK